MLQGKKILKQYDIIDNNEFARSSNTAIQSDKELFSKFMFYIASFIKYAWILYNRSLKY